MSHKVVVMSKIEFVKPWAQDSCSITLDVTLSLGLIPARGFLRKLLYEVGYWFSRLKERPKFSMA